MNSPNKDLAPADRRYYVVQATVISWIDLKALGRAPLVTGPYDLASGPLPKAEAEALRKELYRTVDRETVDLTITDEIARYGLADHELTAKPEPMADIITTEEKP